MQLREALGRGRGRVAVVHMAMHATEQGLIGAWSHVVETVAEPSAPLLHLKNRLAAWLFHQVKLFRRSLSSAWLE